RVKERNSERRVRDFYRAPTISPATGQIEQLTLSKGNRKNTWDRLNPKINKCQYRLSNHDGHPLLWGLPCALSFSFSHCSRQPVSWRNRFLNRTNPTHTAQVSIATPLAGHLFGSRHPETA